MISSEDTSAIIPALVEALSTLEDITKTRTAKIATKTGANYEYTFADLADVLRYARPLLKAQGLAVKQSPFTDDKGTAVVTTFLHTSGQWVQSLPLRMPSGSDAQSHGSSITFARRYQLLAELGLATEDDDGASAREQAPKTQRQANRAPQRAAEPPRTNTHPDAATDAQVKLLAIQCSKAGIEEANRITFVSNLVGRPIKSTHELTKAEISAAIEEMKGTAA